MATRFRLSSAIRRLTRDVRGTVAIIFAVCAVAIMVVAGVAVDFVSAHMWRTKMQSALDGAVLAAVSTVRDALDKGIKEKAALKKGEAAAAAAFNSNLDDGFGALASFSIKKNGLDLVVEGSASASLKAALLSLGSGETKIAAAASASTSMQPYQDIYLLVDISASMLLPSTEAGIDKMVAGTGCALACHDEGKETGTDTYLWAKGQGITLRYEVVNQAIKTFLAYLESDSGLKTHTRVGLWSFDAKLRKQASITSDFSEITSNYPAPTIAANNDVAATPFDDLIGKFIKTVGGGGDGSSQKTARKVVMIASDGVNDPTRSWVDDPSLRPKVRVFDTAFCKEFEGNGVTVAIVNTPYLRLKGDWGYDATLGQLGTYGETRVDDIPIVLKKCAGNLFIEASEPEAIEQSFTTLFERMVTTRLTN